MLKRPKEKGTTIWVKESTKQIILKSSSKGETWDDILRRLASGMGEVDVEILNVDRDSAHNHTVLIRLGVFYYFWNGETFNEIDRTKIMTTMINPELVKRTIEKSG